MMKVGTQPLVWQLNTYYNLIHPHDVPYPKRQVRLPGGAALSETNLRDAGYLVIFGNR